MAIMKGELEKVHQVVNEIEKIIIGQTSLIWKVLTALLADGHVLLEGVPGLAKTLLVATLGKTIGGAFRRIQMVPDMMPSDIVGTYIYTDGKFEVEKGPIISANLVLVDEINRAAAKTQAALLQAMQERQVTIMGKETFQLPDPFMVLATQNPIEHEGTYPLPEAQLDRFLLKLLVDYPSREDEIHMLENTLLDCRDRLTEIRQVFSPEEVVRLREKIKAEVKVEEYAHRYIVDLCRATRNPLEYKLGKIEGKIRIGVSPRGILGLRDVARVQAFLEGRKFVYPEDVQRMAKDVLRHRMILTYSAEMEGVTPDEILDHVLSEVPVP
jgi:MoxR-like ATPase